jgi:hypothetical protein
MLLDLNMWKNQIFYNPKDFGQYTGIGLSSYNIYLLYHCENVTQQHQ